MALRAADYTCLTEQSRDPGNTEDETDDVRAGRMFILPSGYVSGDQYMLQNVHDIIAISHNVGYPDIFFRNDMQLSVAGGQKWVVTRANSDGPFKSCRTRIPNQATCFDGVCNWQKRIWRIEGTSQSH